MARAASIGIGRLRSGTAALSLAGALGLAPPAGAETYRVLRGVLDDAGGQQRALSGWLEASAFPRVFPASGPPEGLFFSDFSFLAGAERLSPRQPIEYQGLAPILRVEVADQLQLEGSAVRWLRLRSGGDLVAEGGGEVTFRFLELRGDEADGGRGVGSLDDSALPRRLHLAGRLVEVEESFRVLDRDCSPPPTPGGGGGGGVIISFDPFELAADETVAFAPPGGAVFSIARVGGDDASLGGSLVAEPGAVGVRAPAPLALGPVTQALAPSLDELGITAPSGAEVTLVGGVLTVETEGDLLVVGDGLSQLPDLTSVRLLAGGSIAIGSDVTWPADVTLELDTGGSDVVASPVIPFCLGLRPVFPPQEREIGHFSLVATAAEPMAIDVRPGSDRNAVRPGSGQRLPVAILTSPRLDPGDLDPRSPRLGPGEAAPRAIVRRRGRGPRAAPVDWLGLFSVRQAEIAYGDELVCLVARRRQGGLLEGCDAIDTRPARRGPAGRRD